MTKFKTYFEQVPVALVKRKIAEQKIESEDPESTGPAEKEMQKTEPYSVPIARKLAGER